MASRWTHFLAICQIKAWFLLYFRFYLQSNLPSLCMWILTSAPKPTNLRHANSVSGGVVINGPRAVGFLCFFQLQGCFNGSNPIWDYTMGVFNSAGKGCFNMAGSRFLKHHFQNPCLRSSLLSCHGSPTVAGQHSGATLIAVKHSSMARPHSCIRFLRI